MAAQYEHMSPRAIYDSDASLSNSSDDDDQLQPYPSLGSHDPALYDYPRPPTPPPQELVTCMWENCGRQFDHLQPLITHVHGMPSIYYLVTNLNSNTTESQRTMLETINPSTHVNGRHALVEACRRPHASPLCLISAPTRAKSPSHALYQVRLTTSSAHHISFLSSFSSKECDKSFTRSDALAKHMRLQHGISPPLPGRGNRKRKRTDGPVPPAGTGPPPPGFAFENGSGNPNTNSLQGLETITPNTAYGPNSNMLIKNESTAEDEEYRRMTAEAGQGPYTIDGDPHPRGMSLTGQTPPPNGAGNGQHYDPALGGSLDSNANHEDGAGPGDEEDGVRELPPSLLQHYNPTKGTVLGRSVPKVQYLVEKAKHRYLLAEHELLLDELEIARKEEARVRESKDMVLDRVFLRELG